MRAPLFPCLFLFLLLPPYHLTKLRLYQTDQMPSSPWKQWTKTTCSLDSFLQIVRNSWTQFYNSENKQFISTFLVIKPSPFLSISLKRFSIWDFSPITPPVSTSHQSPCPMSMSAKNFSTCSLIKGSLILTDKNSIPLPNELSWSLPGQAPVSTPLQSAFHHDQCLQSETIASPIRQNSWSVSGMLNDFPPASSFCFSFSCAPTL